MQETLYHKDSLKILGKLFKRYREDNGYSVRGIARSHNIAHTVISQIENAKIHPNVETLKILFSALDQTLYMDEVFLNVQRENLEGLYDAIYYLDDDQRNHYRQLIEADYDKLMHSVLRIDTLMILCLDTLIAKESLQKEHLSEIKEAYHYLCKEQLETYNLLMGLNDFYTHNYSKAVKHLFKNLESIGEGKRYVLSLYYLAFASHKLFRNYLSFQYADKATKFLSRHNNLRRKLEIDLLKAQKQIDNASYDDANSILMNLENSLHYHENQPRTMQRFKTFKTYIAYSSARYEEALRIIDTIERKSPMYIFLKALILHRLERDQEALALFREVETYEDDMPNNQFVLLARLMINNITDEGDEALINKTIETITANPYRFITIHLYYLAFDLIIAYYKKRKYYKKVMEITEIMLSVSKKRDIHETNHM